MTQPLPVRKRWVPQPLPESKYYHPNETQNCPQCKQPMHSPKFTKKEKVEELEKNRQDGYVILHMRDGIEHRLPTPAVITLLNRVQKTIDWQRGVCPQWICTRHPQLLWFKQAISVQSTDGGRVHEELLSLIGSHVAEGKAS